MGPNFRQGWKDSGGLGKDGEVLGGNVTDFNMRGIAGSGRVANKCIALARSASE
jgi:hypothetical protein